MKLVTFSLTLIASTAPLVNASGEPCPNQFKAVEACYGTEFAQMEDCLVCAHDWMTDPAAASTCDGAINASVDGYSNCVEDGQCDSKCDAEMAELNQCAMALFGCDERTITEIA